MRAREFTEPQAAGCIIRAADTGRWCLQQRSDSVTDPGVWSTWGGGIKPKESLEQCVRRELAEESGYTGPLKLEPLLMTSSYATYIGHVPHEFEPQLNSESQDSCWVKAGEWPEPLHPGLARALAKIKHSVAEGIITEYRNRMFQYIKNIVPTWPDYVVKDWLYANFARGEIQGPNWSFRDVGKDIPKIIQGQKLSLDTKWQLIPDMKFTMDMWEPVTKQKLIGRAGGKSDLGLNIPRDAERHAMQAQLAQQQGGVRKEPVIIVKRPDGYDLIEGWHRTIQHFAMYPDGYTGPAYVAVEHNQQGVEEGTELGSETLRTAQQLVRDLEAELADYYDASRGSVPADYRNQVRRRIEALNQELQDLGYKYAPTAAGKVAPLGTKFVENFGRDRAQGQQSVTAAQSAKTGIYQTDVLGAKAYHAKCMEPNCEWESKRFDRIKQAQAAAEKHAKSHFKQGVAEGLSNDMSTEDIIAYLRQHHDKNLHPDYLDHLTSTNSKFVLKNIPLNSLRTELSGLDRAKVEQYKQMDFSKAPPIVVGSDGNILDGYHRATVAKAMGVPTIKAYVGVKGQQGLTEGLLAEASSDEAWELVGQPVPEIQQFVKQMGYGNDKQSVAKITAIIDKAASTQIPVASIPKLKNLANKGSDIQTLKAVQQISGRPDAEQQYTKLMQARDAGEGRRRDVSGYLQYVKSGNYDPPVLLKLPTGIYVIGGRTRLYAALALGVPANVKIISANSFKQAVAEGLLAEETLDDYLLSLKNRGAKIIGRGNNAMVFTNPEDDRTVIKVMHQPDPAYLAYLRQSGKHPNNPWLPRVLDVTSQAFDTANPRSSTTAWIIVLEKLRPASSAEVKNAVDTVLATVDPRYLGRQPLDAYRTFDDIKKLWPTIAQHSSDADIQVVAKFLSQFPPQDIDLSRANVMMRGPQLVFADPVLS